MKNNNSVVPLALFSFLLVTVILIPNVCAAITIDLNVTSATITVYGDDAIDRSGGSVSFGDINGDGIDDAIIGARYADPAGGDRAGETYVIYGSASMLGTIDLNVTSANVTIYGDDANDYSGHSVSSGDINGDGIADVIIGAPGADPAGGSEAGETYVIYGNASMPGTIDLNAVSANVTIYGDDVVDHSGTSVSSGDINGDGIADIIIGAPSPWTAGGGGAGETYVIYGNASMPGTIDLNAVSANVTIYGDDACDWSGHSVSSGDINGDGIDDVIIGAYEKGVLPSGEAGETYVIYGNASMPSTIDLNAVSANVTIYGEDGNDYLGYSVSSGDINGDGIDDVIIGAPGADIIGDFGTTYVIYGNASMPSTIHLLVVSANVTIYGDDTGDWSGHSVSSGDVNGDGIDDIIIGAPYADPAGETYVIYGNASMPSTIGLTAVSANVTIYGDDAGDCSGHSVSSGDINGDGIDDVIIGAPSADPAGGDEAGETYVICDVVGAPGLNCTCGDICVNTTGWWRDGGAFIASNTPIQHAIDNASEGKTICVKDGNYNENVDVTKRLTVRSENGSASTIVNASDTNDHVFNVTANWVNISGFTVQNATKSVYPQTAGIYLGNSVEHCTISDNNATNNYFGICLWPASNNTLTRNIANSNGNSGISLEQSNNNTVSDNVCNQNTWEGIWLDQSNNNTVSNNTANLNTNSGIYLHNADNNNITCNWVAHNEQRGFNLTDGCTGNNISYNNIMHNGEAKADGSYHWNFYNGQTNPVDAKHNYWVVTDNETIDNSTRDGDSGEGGGGKVTFYPPLDAASPCAPIPEAATIILLSVGLVVLAGYLRLRKRF